MSCIVLSLSLPCISPNWKQDAVYTSLLDVAFRSVPRFGTIIFSTLLCDNCFIFWKWTYNPFSLKLYHLFTCPDKMSLELYILWTNLFLMSISQDVLAGQDYSEIVLKCQDLCSIYSKEVKATCHLHQISLCIMQMNLLWHLLNGKIYVFSCCSQ